MSKYALLLIGMIIIVASADTLWLPSETNAIQIEEIEDSVDFPSSTNTAIVPYNPGANETLLDKDKVKENSKKDVTKPTKKESNVGKDDSDKNLTPQTKVAVAVLQSFLKEINLDKIVNDIKVTHTKRVEKTKDREEERLAEGKNLTTFTKFVDRFIPSAEEGLKFIGRNILVPATKALVANAIPILLSLLI